MGQKFLAKKKQTFSLNIVTLVRFFHDLSMVGRVTLCAGSHSSEENWDRSTILHLNNTMWYNRCFLLAHGLPLRYSKGPPRKKKKSMVSPVLNISHHLFLSLLCAVENSNQVKVSCRTLYFPSNIMKFALCICPIPDIIQRPTPEPWSRALTGDLTWCFKPCTQRICTLHTEKLGIDSRTSLLWGNSANHMCHHAEL